MAKRRSGRDAGDGRAGRRGLDLEMDPADLVAITEAITDRVRAQPGRRAAPASGEEVEGPGQT